jgi:hypothetical protein
MFEKLFLHPTILSDAENMDVDGQKQSEEPVFDEVDDTWLDEALMVVEQQEKQQMSQSQSLEQQEKLQVLQSQQSSSSVPANVCSDKVH